MCGVTGGWAGGYSPHFSFKYPERIGHYVGSLGSNELLDITLKLIKEIKLMHKYNLVLKLH